MSSPVLRPDAPPVPSPTINVRDLDVDVQDRADDLDGSFLGKRYNKERVGWYVFDWANSTFATLGIAMIVPVLLAGLAESYAYQGHVSAQCSEPNYGVGQKLKTSTIILMTDESICQIFV